jgi:hypothetical protein
VNSQKPARKFATEFGVNMVGLGVVLLTQEDFPQLESPEVAERLRVNPCHIYMVCRRPRLMFDKDSLSVSQETISGQFLLQEGLTVTAYPFTARNDVGTELRLECPYPHTAITMFSPAGERLHHSKAALLARYIGSEELRTKLALEVLYIGQAYGTDGKRTAPDRLKAHSTLQAIYSEAISRSPDKEVWLALWNFEPQLLTFIDGLTKQYQTTFEEDDAHIHQVISTPISGQQRINFTEAALINYFKPEYNITFKNIFPSPAHATYSECYELDINSLIVEVDTEDFDACLWTPSVEEKWHHLITYGLHSAEERRSMFDFFIPDSDKKSPGVAS